MDNTFEQIRERLINAHSEMCEFIEKKIDSIFVEPSRVNVIRFNDPVLYDGCEPLLYVTYQDYDSALICTDKGLEMFIEDLCIDDLCNIGQALTYHNYKIMAKSDLLAELNINC